MQENMMSEFGIKNKMQSQMLMLLREELVSLKEEVKEKNEYIISIEMLKLETEHKDLQIANLERSLSLSLPKKLFEKQKKINQ
jgi:hypothetical protein